MWCLTAGPVVCIPMILTEFPQGKHYESFFKKQNFDNCFTFSAASSLVCTSLLAVITVVGLLDVVMVSNSAELRSFLLTICILVPESPTNCFSLALLMTQQEYPFLRGKVECSLVSFSEFVYVFSKIPSLASGTSLLSFSLFIGPVFKFHSVRTSLMRTLILIFPNDGPFFSWILA